MIGVPGAADATPPSAPAAVSGSDPALAPAPAAAPPVPEPQPVPPPLPLAPAATAAAAAPVPDTVSEPPSLEGRPDANKCLLTPVCLGPMVTLLSIGPMSPGFGLGIRANVGDYFGGSIDYEFLPKISFAGAAINSGTFSATGRVYPFGGKFFIGGGFGYTHLAVSYTSDDIDVAANVGVPIALINLGMTGRTGFVFGIDLALVIPMAKLRSKVSVAPGKNYEDEYQQYQDHVDDDELASKQQEAADELDKYLNELPVSFQINFVRLGYIF
jgi:hypothetical protein